ncbi:Hint domain-containing protein [Thioclava sp. GXIMD4216]|uniref:Hint domain-containing protein n=1 Tax=Thioclava sp. GXIMD4216 TaxID=3131929 RepID=UPI0030CEC09F
MAVFNLNFFDLSYASTTAGTFSNNGGYQFTVNVDTITLQPGATSDVLQVDDQTNATFDDDDNTQTLAAGYTIGGVNYAAGTIIEAEYDVIVQDSLGNTYTLQFVSLNGDAWNIEGFVIQGTPPPYGEPLTVIQAIDYTSGSYAYATSAPSCFGPRTRFLMADGQQKMAQALRQGDMLRCHDGTAAPVAMLLQSRVPLDSARDHRPIRLRAHALGNGLPGKTLILSAHHRVYIAEIDALLPASSLLVRPRIGRAPEIAGPYIHIVLQRHAVIFANGLPCESFWPGPVALSLLPPEIARKIRKIMGRTPTPAKPLWPMRAAQRHTTHALAQELRISLPQFGP